MGRYEDHAADEDHDKDPAYWRERLEDTLITPVTVRRHADDLTTDWPGFCNLWRYVGAHNATYGDPPHYGKTAKFLASGGFLQKALDGNSKRN